MPQSLSRRAFLGGTSRDARLVAAVNSSCLAVNRIACSACADPCEPRALRVRPLGGGRAVPVIDAAACTGCGACLEVCPASALSLTENARCA